MTGSCTCLLSLPSGVPLVAASGSSASACGAQVTQGLFQSGDFAQPDLVTGLNVTVLGAVQIGIQAGFEEQLFLGAVAGTAMVMRPIAGGIPIPANRTTTLEPGGLHVMIMDAKASIAPGDDVHVTLTLSDGSTLLFHATAKEFAGANESYDGGTSAVMDMGTTGMDMGSSSAESSHDDSGTEATHTHG